MRANLCLLIALTACVGACSSNNNGGGGGGAGGNGGSGGAGGGGGIGMGGGGGTGGGGDMALPPGTTMMRLVTSHYSIPPGKEFYQCEQITLPSDVYIVKVIPVSPLGVHHEVLAIDPSAHADGTYTSGCGAIGFNWTPLFASGVGSPALDMPANVALKVGATQHVVLNLHLFNASTTNTLDGDAAVDVIIATNPSGYQLAAVPFAGNVTFTVPSTAPYQVQGQCTVSNATKYFAVFPHMHQTGAHMKIWTEAGATQTVVWDEDYSFNEQKFGQFPNWMGPQEIALNQGDKIKLTCTYDAKGAGIKFGDKSTDEMCFAISYVYPAISTTAGSPFCIN
jgi:hypothetical protein